MSRRDRSRGGSDDGGGGGDWLTTYSDLVTLLLCFFVLLFSMSEVDAEKFREMAESLKVSFDGGAGVLDGSTSVPDIPLSQIENLIDGDDDLRNLYSQLQEYSDKQGLGDEISVAIEERGIVVRFKDNVLFDSGSAQIKEDALEIIKAAADILNQDEFKDRHIKIEGHTDSDPIIRSNKYPTNWELSSARATNVLRYLVENEGMDGRRISSSGYSEYRPLAPNDTKENKAKNRRVDIVILRDDFKELEPETRME